MISKYSILLAASFVLLAPPAGGDMGSIPLTKGAKIYEPNQDAIIAWNGVEQLLYLKTTLRSSVDTKVIEVMPLPNRPVVETVDSGIFKRVGFFLPAPDSAPQSSDPFGTVKQDPARPAGEVVERKTLGAHSLATVRVDDLAGFTEWVKGEFGKIQEVDIPEPLLKVVQDYLDDGYGWFLFDTIDLSTHSSEKVTLKIRFKTDHLFYPMRITQVETGDTEVNLTVITDVLFEAEDLVGMTRDEIEVAGHPRSFPSPKLTGLDPAIPTLFDPTGEVNVRSWKIQGELSRFTQDLLVRHPSSRTGNRN